MKKMTDKKLQKEFDRLNFQFFQSKIMLTYVGFSNTVRMKHADGVYNSDKKYILIDSGLRGYENLTSLVLLHEMAHAYLDLQDYKGYPVDGGHGMRFQVELDRLYRIGALDGLL
jgi:hypothetical protein